VSEKTGMRLIIPCVIKHHSMFPQCRRTHFITLTVYQLNIRPTRQQWSLWGPDRDMK